MVCRSRLGFRRLSVFLGLRLARRWISEVPRRTDGWARDLGKSTFSLNQDRPRCVGRDEIRTPSAHVEAML